MKISARAFKRIFSCKIWLRYSRARALSSLPSLGYNSPGYFLTWISSISTGMPRRRSSAYAKDGRVPTTKIGASSSEVHRNLSFRLLAETPSPTQIRMDVFQVVSICRSRCYFLFMFSFHIRSSAPIGTFERGLPRPFGCIRLKILRPSSSSSSANLLHAG